MTQIELLTKIAILLKDLPETVTPSGNVEWKPLPGVPFGLPLGKPMEYMRVGNKTTYRKPDKPIVFTKEQVTAILHGKSPSFQNGSTMNVFQMLEYLGFNTPVKLAEVILKEYELELSLNDTYINSWLPGVIHEGKTLALELLLGYDGYCGYGVSVTRTNIAWEAYEKECRDSNIPINWSHTVNPDYQLFVRPSMGDNGLDKGKEMTVPEFLEYVETVSKK